MREKPTPPAASECCESQCDPCVWDTYFEDLKAWKEEQKTETEAQQNTADTEQSE